MQNFGKITNSFNGILVEGLASKDVKSKEIFKRYIKTIRENEILKSQFMIYNNIENKIEVSEFKANLFLQENLSLLSKFSKKEIEAANIKLVNSMLIEDKDYPKQKLHEDLSTLIFVDKTSKTIDAIVEATSNVIEYMKNNKAVVVTEGTGLPNSMLSAILVAKYNEKYAILDESEKAIINVLTSNDSEKKKEVYGATLRECIDLIDGKLNESSLDAKDKLLRVKDKLLNDKQEINEDFAKNISKLVNLRESLK